MHILLQQNVLAHYRHALVRELGTLDGLSVSIVSSWSSDATFIEFAPVPIAPTVRTVEAPVKTWSRWGIALSWQPGAIRALSLRPDVVIAMGSPYSLTAWALVLLGRLRKIPVLLWTHGILASEAGMKWQIRAILFRLASGLLLYGDRAHDLLVKQGIDPKTIHVIYNSLDVREQERQYARTLSLDMDQLRANWDLEDADRVLIFTGRLLERKALDRLIEAIARLKDSGRRVHLLLLGDGSLRNALESQSRALGVHERIHFFGAVHAEDRLAEAFRVSDLCVIPSGPGLTVMHAMGYGVPVLTTDQTADQYPEAEAVVPGKTGFLCDTSSPVALAAELERILYPQSPRPLMEDACRKVIFDRFTPNKQARRMEEAARQVLRRNFGAT